LSNFYAPSLPQTDRPINSKGHSFATVQAALDDLGGDGFVYVPPGTYAEAVTISDNNVLLFGAGRSSYINGGTTSHAIAVSGDTCIVRDLRVSTTGGSGNVYHGVYTTGLDIIVENVYVSASDYRGISIQGARGLALRCHVSSCDNEGIAVAHTPSRVVGNYVDDTLITSAAGDDSVIVSNYITGAVTIHVDSEDCVVDSNRAPGGITDNSGTSTVGDNDET
jgi:hypothetical protein